MSESVEKNSCWDGNEPPLWAMRLACKVTGTGVVSPFAHLDIRVARAIADAVDAARLEAAIVAEGRADYNDHYHDIMALRGKEPKP